MIKARTHKELESYLLSKGTVEVYHVCLDKELVNPLTKGITRKKVLNTSNRMGLMPKGHK